MEPEETKTSEESPETSEETTETSEANEGNPAETDSSKDSSAKEETEQVQEFLSLEDKDALNQYLEQHPEMKPMVEHLHKIHKNMQSGFTKAMQNVPKKYRDSKILTQMEQSHQILEKMRNTPGFESALNEIISKGNSGVKEGKTETSESLDDILTKNMPDATDDEIAGIKRLLPVLDHLFNSKLKPITEKSEKAEEQAEKIRLASDKRFADIEISDFWDDAMKIRKEYPGLPIDKALILAIQQTEVFVDEEGNEYHSVAEYQQAKGKKSALTTKKPADKSSFVVGGGKESDKSLRNYSQAEIDKMTPEEYAEKMNLSRVGE